MTAKCVCRTQSKIVSKSKYHDSNNFYRKIIVDFQAKFDSTKQKLTYSSYRACEPIKISIELDYTSHLGEDRYLTSKTFPQDFRRGGQQCTALGKVKTQQTPRISKANVSGCELLVQKLYFLTDMEVMILHSRSLPSFLNQISRKKFQFFRQ